jgi:N-acetylmuramoyl-L-alanine amidase
MVMGREHCAKSWRYYHMDKKLALIVGHNAKAKGAVRVDTGESEYDFNRRVAGLAMEYARKNYPGLHVVKILRAPSDSVRDEIRAAYARADALGVDATIELHFNAHSNKSARGCETLHPNTTAGNMLACQVQMKMIAAFPELRNRGIKQVGPSERGGVSLTSSFRPAVIVEPFFGSNQGDCEMTKGPDAERRLAAAWIDAAAEFLEVTRSTPTPPPMGREPSFFVALMRRFFGGANT